jgi:hypothetical protein
VLIFIVSGSVYLLTSVGVSIYRRRHVVPIGAKVSNEVTDAELRSCYEELDDVVQGLQKHLENFHHLMAGYDPVAAQGWAEEGVSWNAQWKALGERCRFGELRLTRMRKELEAMAAAYDDLGQTHDIYTKAFRRFGTEQAPRMDRIRQRMKEIGERLATSPARAPGESKP